MNTLRIRPLQRQDSLDALTALLHRAFGAMAARGIDCNAARQGVADTLTRIARGRCFVACTARGIVGTLTLEPPDTGSECAWYRRPSVMTLHQFAVDPTEQGHGWGRRLMAKAEQVARSQGYGELALETPVPAVELVRFYLSLGFREVGRWQKQGKAYCSVVLSKRLAQQDVRTGLASRTCGVALPASALAAPGKPHRLPARHRFQWSRQVWPARPACRLRAAPAPLEPLSFSCPHAHQLRRLPRWTTAVRH